MFCKLHALFIAIFSLSLNNYTYGLTLSQYLKEVAANNEAYQSSELLSQAGFNRSNEGSLSLTPSFIGSTSYMSDSNSGFRSRANSQIRTINEDFRAGFAKKFSTGTDIKLEYDALHNEIDRPKPNPDNTSWYVRPILGIKQSLSRDWLGGETKALIEFKNSQAKAQGYLNNFNNKKMLVEAEMVYWDLATVVANIVVKQDSVTRSSKLAKWAGKRSKSGLGNDSDLLQAESSLEQRKFELAAVQDFLKSKVRLFNAYRTLSSDTVPDNLESFNKFNASSLQLKSTSLPSKIREDLHAQYENYLSAKAKAKAATQSLKPDLNFNLEYYPSGKDAHYTHTNGAVWRGRNPTISVALDFSVPLDRTLIRDLNGAYKAESHAAELAYSRKKFELTNEWQRLTEQFNLFAKQLTIAEKIVETQRQKLRNEEDLLRNGRTTTFQVLQFEQDYFNAQSQYLDTKNNLLKLSAMMKLFE